MFCIIRASSQTQSPSTIIHLARNVEKGGGVLMLIILPNLKHSFISPVLIPDFLVFHTPYRNPNPVCTKTLKWMQPNERNVTGSSITINFHSRWGKKTYLNAKKFEISQTWFAVWTCVRNNYSRKSESVSFSHKFCSYFIGCGFAYRAKSWVQLRINTSITIFVF